MKHVRNVIVFAALIAPWAAFAQQPPAWPDTFLARVEALALIQTLNAEILGSRSATLTLESWCRDHRLAAEPKILARMVSGPSAPLTAEQRQRLQVSGDGEVKYRRVQLQCGSHTLSEADNWYVPSRLSPDMNRLLETTDTPFGKAVESLQPYRQTFSVTLLWTPLPAGWERLAAQPGTTGRGTLTMPSAMFEHRAVLYDREHKPFSEVRETYQRDILAFPPPTQP